MSSVSRPLTSLRRPQWWRDCLAASWHAKQRGRLGQEWLEPGGKYFELPEVYKQYWYDKITHEEAPVHYQITPGKWEQDPETGEDRPVENRPIPVIYPEESQQGLWGGEGVIKGYERARHRSRIWPQPKMWWPTLRREVFYSEILNKHLLITCTSRTLDLVDDCCGFDHYILKTHEVDLKSALGMTLKRRMLRTLLDDNLTAVYPTDSNTREKIYNRYKQYMKTAEEIEWMGLKPNRALMKHIKEGETRGRESREPLKHVYRDQLMQELESNTGGGEDEQEESVAGALMSKLRSTFSSKEGST